MESHQSGIADDQAEEEFAKHGRLMDALHELAAGAGQSVILVDALAAGSIGRTGYGFSRGKASGVKIRNYLVAIKNK